MVGALGVYRRKAGVDPSHKNGARFSDELPRTPQIVQLEAIASADPTSSVAKTLETLRERRKKEFENWTGLPYYDHAAFVIADNADGTVDVRIHGVPGRDDFDTKVIRSAPVAGAPTVGAFTQNNIAAPVSNTMGGSE